MATRIGLETIQKIIDGIDAVARLHPLIGSKMSVSLEQLAVVLDLEFVVERGIDRGPVCVEVAEAFSQHVPIGKFPSFSIQEHDSLLEKNGYGPEEAPMHVGLFVIFGQEAQSLAEKIAPVLKENIEGFRPDVDD